ncbi:hypothetical protein CKAH01_03553 [Colletotrichum kahawae]|uniref:Uncharacterized protein n=1 Tax=Colletotrichum kahawae TaxID=34407 RepID=A0AAD9YQ55_COLKA|nr:hypothetical protein CKAH01_03553 [Colletotrichum kahawae]
MIEGTRQFKAKLGRRARQCLSSFTSARNADTRIHLESLLQA